MSEKGQKISDFTTRLTDLEKSVVCNMATSIRTSRSVLHIYGKINSSQTRCVNRLKEKKIIKELPSGFIYTFTKQGIDLLERDYHDWYEFYMRYTSNNRPGGTETHKAASIRISELVAMMQVCDIKIGPQKTNPYELFEGKPKNNPQDNVFYLMKELKFEKNQREARTSTSRASAIIFSRGINALAYNCYDTPMNFHRKCERETAIHMIGFYKSLFSGEKKGEIKEAILFSKDDNSAFRIINTNKGGRMIGDAIKSKNAIGLTFRYIPISTTGTEYLKRITDFTESAIKTSLFTEKEIAAAQERGIGDAIIGKLICYEFVSCNISKVMNAFNIHKGHIHEIGFVIDSRQIEMFRLLQRDCGEKMNVRKLSPEDINKRLYGKEKILQ